MKVFAILSLASVAFAGLVERAACPTNGNNCQRAVTGTGGHLPSPSVRSAGCSDFVKTTVTPDPVTETVTITVDGDEPAKFRRHFGEMQARAEPTIPSWAANCKGDAKAFANACECYGITATTQTAPTPTKTETVTVTDDYCEDL